MTATTGDARTDCGRAGQRADSTGVDNLAAGNGDVDGQLLEALWRKGQRIVTEHNHVSQFPHLNAPERLLLKARVGGVDGWLRRASAMVSASPAVIVWPLSV